jgi:ATP-binding cassette subfamily F protein 3
VNLSFPRCEIRNRRVFSLVKVGFSYGSQPANTRDYLLSAITLSAGTKDKLCLMGANGSGKSTILKLAQRLLKPTEGQVRLNRNVDTAYVPQGLVGFFPRRRLLDNFSETGQDETTIRRFLGGALIRKDKAGDRLDSFSYGELMRAAIVKCILIGAEFLFLDEPTSHLDIESVAVLERLLSNFAGGFLLVSHDRSLVANTADSLYLIESGRLRLV